MALGIVVERQLVHRPEIEVVGLQTPQRLLELVHPDLRIAPMRAHLRHEEDPIPAANEGPAHALLALSLVILPGVVHERDAGIDGFMDDPRRVLLRRHLPEVIAAESDSRHVLSRAAEGAARYLVGRWRGVRGRRSDARCALRPGGWHGGSPGSRSVSGPARGGRVGRRLDRTPRLGRLSRSLNRKSMKGTKDMKEDQRPTR